MLNREILSDTFQKKKNCYLFPHVQKKISGEKILQNVFTKRDNFLVYELNIMTIKMSMYKHFDTFH